MEKQYEKGKLYQWNGHEFVELEPSGELKIPVTEEAVAAIKATRKAAQIVIGMRPELSLVASAMILEAAQMPAIAESVKSYGQRVYNSVVNAKTDGDSQKQQQEAPAEAHAKPEQQSTSSYL
ncbi:MAG: hypothetical protein P4L87_20610 [Formivibrio sp.]|nr:hypothetical protein [Formivibrio sp.]